MNVREGMRRVRLVAGVLGSGVGTFLAYTQLQPIDDGQRVHRTDPPGLWRYLRVFTFPVLGFLIPWGAIRALTWIGVGFSAGESR